METLGEVGAEVAEQRERPLVLDPLGDRLQAEQAADADDAADEPLVVGVVGQRPDVRAVDLDVAERQVAQVGEGAEAGPEVIEREPASQRLDVGGESASGLQVLDDRCLGDLEDDPLRGLRLGNKQLEDLAPAPRRR